MVDAATTDALSCIPYKAKAIMYRFNATYADSSFNYEHGDAINDITYGGKTYTVSALAFPWYATVGSIVPMGATGTSTVAVRGEV